MASAAKAIVNAVPTPDEAVPITDEDLTPGSIGSVLGEEPISAISNAIYDKVSMPDEGEDIAGEPF